MRGYKEAYMRLESVTSCLCDVMNQEDFNQDHVHKLREVCDICGGAAAMLLNIIKGSCGDDGFEDESIIQYSYDDFDNPIPIDDDEFEEFDDGLLDGLIE